MIYSEASMAGAGSAGNYEMTSGATEVAVASVEDVSSEGRIFRLQIGNFDPYLIYGLTVEETITDHAGNSLTGQRTFTLNDDDQDGMADEWERIWEYDLASMDASSDRDRDGVLDVEEYTYAAEHPELGPARWTLSPQDTDSDDDDIPDSYEMQSGLNPVDNSDRDLDADGNGSSNYEEYVQSVVAPIVDVLSADPAIESIPYTGPLPTLFQGSLPVTWSLAGEIPSGMEIDPVTGVVYWPAPVPGEGSHTITIRAENLAGSNESSFDLTVVPYRSFVYVKGSEESPTGGDGTLESPWPSISGALAEVQTWLSPKITVRVAAGIYLENLSVLRTGIELEGGWSSDFTQRWDFDQSGVEPLPEYETIIDGQYEGSVILAGTDTTIDGFTITGGYGTNGGGISGGDGLAVSNCVIIGNSADVAGGGIYLSSGTETTLGPTSIKRCLIAYNDAQFGGGIYTRNVDVWQTVISQCTFTWNWAASGGGMFNTESSPYIVNCTFSQNAASGYGGAIGNFDGSTPELRNSILWNDSAGVLGEEVYNDATSTTFVAFSDIKGCST